MSETKRATHNLTKRYSKAKQTIDKRSEIEAAQTTARIRKELTWKACDSNACGDCGENRADVRNLPCGCVCLCVSCAMPYAEKPICISCFEVYDNVERAC